MLRINGIQRLWTARNKNSSPFGINLKPKYMQRILHRLSKLLGKNACKATDGLPFNSEGYKRV